MMQSRTTFTVWAATVALGLSTMVSSAALLGEYTFDNRTTLTTALGATSVVGGLEMSQLGTNTTTQLDYAGLNASPVTDNDGFGFGGHYGQYVMFFHRATTADSAWGTTVGTGAATAPLNFTVTALAGQTVTVDSISVMQTSGTDILYYFQEAGMTKGAQTLIATAHSTVDIPLTSPVTVAEGTSKTFTINITSGAYNQAQYINNIAVNGSVEGGGVSPVIGKYTFNNPSTMVTAMGPTALVDGAMLSMLGTNTTTQLDFAGFNASPDTAFDGFGFGGYSGPLVMFFHRAESGNPSAWGSLVGTGASTAPLNFTVSADDTHEITVESVSINQANGTSILYFFQEAGAAGGASTLCTTAGTTVDVPLDSPVAVAAGTSKTFTLLVNSGAYNQAAYINNIAINGTVSALSLPNPATIVGIASVSGNSVRVAVDAPDALNRYYPESTTDLVSGVWETVAHSDDGVNTSKVASLSYSTPDGSNAVIYLEADADERFFRMQGGALPRFTLWQLPSQSHPQMMSYVIKSAGGKVIVIDGGNTADASYLKEFLEGRGNHVNSWFITHPHADHVDALTSILGNPGDLVVDEIYAAFPPEDWMAANYDPNAMGAYQAFTNAMSTAGRSHVDLGVGDIMDIDEIQIEVLFIGDTNLTQNAANDYSLVMRFSDPTKTVLFTGDIGPQGGNAVLAAVDYAKLKADYVQMAHHGQACAGENFWQVVQPDYCLWPTPLYLWNNDVGGGFNTGPYGTVTTRGWMEALDVKSNYVSGVVGLVEIK